MRGLDFTDVSVHGEAKSPAPRRLAKNYKQPRDQQHVTPFEAVMQVLILGKESKSTIPNRIIKQISVDREIGITLLAFNQLKTIVLGYHDYPRKYAMLKNILVYRKQKQSFPDFNHIDLNNLHRIVVNPIGQKSRDEDQKEV